MPKGQSVAARRARFTTGRCPLHGLALPQVEGWYYPVEGPLYTLMAVHAHPDDESSSTGGLLRLAAEQGHTTILVTCTNGALGEVNIPDLRLNPRQYTADRQSLALKRQE